MLVSLLFGFTYLRVLGATLQKKDGLIIFSYMFLVEGIIIRVIQDKKKYLYITKN